MQITIDKNHIYSRVEQFALYIAAKAADATAETIDNTAIIADDRAILSDFLDEAVRTTISIVRWLVISVVTDCETVTLNLDCPRHHPDAQAVQSGELEHEIGLFLAHTVAARWLALSANPAAAACAQLADSDIQRIRSLFLTPGLR